MCAAACVHTMLRGARAGMRPAFQAADLPHGADGGSAAISA
jgi:hypothetical protein